MILEEIIVANGTAVLLLLTLFVSRYVTRRYQRPEEKLFTVFIFIGIACATLETLSFVVDGKASTFLRIFNIIDNSLLYACTATVSLIWIWFVDLSLNHDTKRMKTVYMPMTVIWAGLVLSLIFNAIFQFYFKVDANNVYSRELLGYIFYVFLVGSFILSIIVYIRFRIKHGGVQFFPIWMFLAPVIIGCVIQVIYYGISLAWLGCAIGLLAVHLSIVSKFSFLDSLTGLYNRAYLEHKLIVARERKKYAYAGIMLDVDYFKEINDTYGHSVGDDALREVAKIVVSACNRNSFAFRFAGDEFIILLRVPSVMVEELEATVEDVKDRVRRQAEKFNSGDKCNYKIRFSMGHAIYNIEEEDDLFFHNMDSAMYKEKREHHRDNKKTVQ